MHIQNHFVVLARLPKNSLLSQNDPYSPSFISISIHWTTQGHLGGPFFILVRMLVSSKDFIEYNTIYYLLFIYSSFMVYAINLGNEKVL